MADSYTYEQKIAFIKNLYCPARQCADESGCSWELILAQAAQETGWGEKVLPRTNNIFNIKATPDWQGESKTFHVWEKIAGEKIWINALFRTYPSVLDSLRDRQKFLQDNPRYTTAGLYSDDVRGDLFKEAQALKRGGYATDEAYATKLKDVFDGPTMQHAIAAAKKDGCKGCLPTINVTIRDAARAELVNTKVKASQGSSARELITDSAGHIQIQAALSGGLVSIAVWSEHDNNWIAIEEKITPTSPPTAVTLLAPTVAVSLSTEQHQLTAATADSAGNNPGVTTGSHSATVSAFSATYHGHVGRYTIKKGDSLSRIAKAHSTSYRTLARLNGISSPYCVYPGQILKVPALRRPDAAQVASMTTSGPTPAPATPAYPASSQSALPAATTSTSSSSADTTQSAVPAPGTQQSNRSPMLHPVNAVHAVHYRSEANHPQTDVLSARRAPWMMIAEQEFRAGVRRRGGAHPDQRIEEYFSATSLGRQRSDNLAYCAAFVNWCLTRAGFHGNNSAGARSLSTWGRATQGNKPAYGAIAIVHFPTGGHHVTFVNGKAPSRSNAPRISTLGGNQGHAHEVSHSAVPASWITHYRFPIGYVEDDEDYVLEQADVDNAQMSAASTH